MTLSAQQLATLFADEAALVMRESLAKIEHCAGQLNEDQLWWRPTPEQNSVANLILHLCGNIRQWIVSGVGGAVDARDRPREFAERGGVAKAELLARLRCAIDDSAAVLARLDPAELAASRRIQGFDTTVIRAVVHVATHLQGHAQEIVSLTRQQLGSAYQFDFVPRTPEQGAAS